MQIDLASVGMEKGKQYETIITTTSCDDIKNAAPIGVICAGQDKVLNRIFKGSRTLENIISKREFIVNITHNPEVFTLSTVGNLPEDYFNEDNSLKCADAYFKCEVISLKEAVKQSDPVKSNGEAIVIKSKVTQLVINKQTRPINRGFGYVIESLSNLTRVDIVGEEQKEEYFERFREANRIVTKVGYKQDIEAMQKIKKELIKKGFKP
ncbi:MULTISPECIES: DUF447 domain-containing protein [Methanobrevibacter]|uniref:DUF447 domain-containing protein n=1 Tax=Methanobrevibacter TaxID=2172 RepID=UPI0015B8431F|nr:MULTISPECIES: DUF447 domain-containing protein [Methanobrevibacter]MBS7257525.1 DUF447 family protein [Methanobrevibacter sp.]MCI7428875.1 DUF447 family protein [Methanobrevibacter sp.]MDD6776132.1 DUF447 family protein [Methanobacteriaceae archaeon]MDY3096424.1 DUF447 family protein [Methanobrevibacter sp.]